MNHSYWFWAGVVMISVPHVVSLFKGLQKDDTPSQLYATLIAFVYFILAWWFIIAWGERIL